jgi:hypothetical protein
MKTWKLALGFLLISGCFEGDPTYYGPSGGALSCRQFKICDDCTRVLGCGWCQIGSTGVCTTEPSACWRATSFVWTWEAAFCPGAEDGGARQDGSVDVAGDGSSDSGASTDGNAAPPGG